jgi:hypothetical protein
MFNLPWRMNRPMKRQVALRQPVTEHLLHCSKKGIGMLF